MNKNPFVIDEYLGIRDAEKYEIEDSDEKFMEWKNLHAGFMREFGRFSSPEDADYAFPDWYHGIKNLAVYLHSERFYDEYFIEKVTAILKENPESLAQFECYDNDQKYLGSFQVYLDGIVFDNSCEESHLIERLIPGHS